MADNYPSKKGNKIQTGDADKKKSDKGPHGGGNSYNQAKIAKGFLKHDSIPGHSQKKNTDKS